MSTAASRLLAPAILVVLVAGIIAAAIEGNDSDPEAAGRRATTTTVERDRDDDEDDDEEVAGSTSSTSTTSGATTTTAPGGSTTTTRPGATTTTPPAGPATTAAPAPGPTSPPTPADADLVLHVRRVGATLQLRIENAGPGTAPDISLVIPESPGTVSMEGAGVDCSGTGTITCTIATAGVGGIIGAVDLAVPGGCVELSASVTSAAADPVPANNAVSQTYC